METNVGERLKRYPSQISGTYEWRLNITDLMQELCGDVIRSAELCMGRCAEDEIGTNAESVWRIIQDDFRESKGLTLEGNELLIEFTSGKSIMIMASEYVTII